LGQAFEDDLEKIYRGKRNELPSFFANLVPEGPLRDLVEASLGIAPGDDMALLEAVGRDLPGAVEITATEELEGFEENGTDDPTETPPEIRTEEGALRFSLAGVQLKFSVLREAEKLTLPVHNQLGDWIVKLDSARFPRLVENEFAIMQWARAAGFEVPECEIQPATVLSPMLSQYAMPGTNVLVIQRYDREGLTRIHQEDFAQVTGLQPERKYDQISYQQCALLAREIIGEEAYFELVRRLVFMLASGNSDAHLKNWSLIYPDGVNARLSPLYDQVCTIAWPDVPKTAALRFCGKKYLLEIDLDSFGRLATVAHEHGFVTQVVVQQALQRIAETWQEAGIQELLPVEHAAVLRAYWANSRLLSPLAGKLLP
jgi:serine/threonine-protein kinase HipA